VFKKAALSLKHIIVGHPFFDGNKRTAFEVTDIVLRDEGYYIHVIDEKYNMPYLKSLNMNVKIMKLKNG